MTNAWSLLYDEMNESDTFNINIPRDTVISGGEGTDTITLGAGQYAPYHSSMSAYSTDTITFDLGMPRNNNYKYSEEKILKELSEYINGTYNQHYSAGDDKIQTLDLIEAVETVKHSADLTFLNMPLVMIRKAPHGVTL